jgi:hypothetical protein
MELGRYMYFLVFFTTWNVLLVIFHRYTRNYVDLLYQSFVVMFVGTYFLLVNPGEVMYRVGNKAYHLTGLSPLNLLSHLSHVGALAYILYLTYGTREMPKARIPQTLTSVMLLLAYGLLVDIRYVYGVSISEAFLVFCIASAFFFALIGSKGR